MPVLAFGNMFDFMDQADEIIVTTNGCIKKDGSNVMGAGAALQAKKLFTGVDSLAGDAIQKKGKFVRHENGLDIYQYGYISTQSKIGLLQTKLHFRDDSPLDLIKKSLYMLHTRALADSWGRFFVNFPGIGRGNLSPSVVLPHILVLPKNVWVWARYQEEVFTSWENHAILSYNSTCKKCGFESRIEYECRKLSTYLVFAHICESCGEKSLRKMIVSIKE